MLTKDLLKYKIRKGELFPEFLSPASEGPFKLASLLLSGLEDARGLSRAELERRWDDCGAGIYSWSGGFRKIILDQITWQEPDDNWPETRMKILLEAQKLRSETLFPEKEAFQESAADLRNTSYPELARELYKDLPEERPVEKTPEYTPAELINRYNCALAQSLLMRSKNVQLTVRDLSTQDKRMLFQSIRFHQLIADVEPESQNTDTLTLGLDGPLSVLDGAQRYGVKLANFFPRILLCKKWELIACIETGTGKKAAIMNLSEASGLKSHYRAKNTYIPEEFDLFREQFNRESRDWQVREGCNFVHLGSQSYCFPDFEFTHPDYEPVGLELFHRWHQGSLPGRLQTLQKHPARSLLLGVCRQLQKKGDVKKLVEESEWFQSNGFLFKDFPTVKTVLSLLGQHGSV